MGFKKLSLNLVIKFTNILFVPFMLFALIGVSQVYAQSGNPPTADQINAIAKQLYCPVCENTPLDVCPTQACAQWRDVIRDKLVAGWNEKQIKEYFVNQYGDRVLAEPPKRGLNWLVYVLPPMFFLGGLVLVYKNIKNARKLESTITSAPIVEDDPFLKEFEDVLRKMEENGKNG